MQLLQQELDDLLVENETSASNLSQACVSLFDAEFEKGNAYIALNKSIGFKSGVGFALYYQLSEQLKHKNERMYKIMISFLVKNYWMKD